MAGVRKRVQIMEEEKVKTDEEIEKLQEDVEDLKTIEPKQ